MDNLKDSLKDLYIWQNYLPDPVRSLLSKLDRPPQTDEEIQGLVEELKKLGYNKDYYKMDSLLNTSTPRKRLTDSKTLIFFMFLLYATISVVLAYVGEKFV